MAEFTFLRGYRRTSSWSLRPYLVLRKADADFSERLVPYRTPEGRAELLTKTPAGRVPVLVHHRPQGDLAVWESLAIAEYLAERFPEKHLWPADPAARAIARAAANEMHAGFMAMREHLSMDISERLPGVGLDQPGVADNVARVEALWQACRTRFGATGGGPFLFGAWSIADAMFTPVASRFRTYAVPLSAPAQAYADALLADPAFLAWEAGIAGEHLPPPL